MIKNKILAAPETPTDRLARPVSALNKDSERLAEPQELLGANLIN